MHILNALHNVNNPNILRYLGNGNGQLALNGEQPRVAPYIIFENASKYDLFSYNMLRRFSEKQAKLIFKKILNGVRAIHNANYCHLNIKPSNILFDENYNPKIYGFYCCRLNENHLQVGTKEYMAPEIWDFHLYNGFKCDIFSLGQ
jgi:serine/threonine protein kinase